MNNTTIFQKGICGGSLETEGRKDTEERVPQRNVFWSNAHKTHKTNIPSNKKESLGGLVCITP